AKFFAENPPPEDEFRNLNWAIEVNKHYNARYQAEPFNVLVDDKGQPVVEMPFALKLFDYEQPIMRFKATSEGEYVEQLYNTIPVYYTGRIDLPVMWDNQL